jgi:phosphocarrier protein
MYSNEQLADPDFEKIVKNSTFEPKQRVIPIINHCGLHLRSSDMLVQLTTQFYSEIFMARTSEIEAKRNQINAKSLMSVGMFAGYCGEELIFTAIGKDAEESLDAVEKLFANKFGEEI